MSPHEDTARNRKVVALLNVLPIGRTQAENDLISLLVESFTALQRGAFEQLAGVRKCSDTTWHQVSTVIQARHVPGDGGSAPDRKLLATRYSFATQAERDAFDAGVTAACRAVGL